MLRVESVPLPLAVGVTELGLTVICPAPMAAPFSEQSENEAASYESVTAEPLEPHFVALAVVVDT